MITFTSVMTSLVAVALAVFIAQMATELDEELNACGTGVFKDGKCQCVSPYTGTHCELVDCGFGELIDSQFLVDSITTPRYENDKKIIPGCKCDAKFWGYNCANCTSTNPTDCTGFCKDKFYGTRCDILCKESDAADEQGVKHRESGGTYNFYVENPGEPFGLCQYDGSVRCREGRAGPNCQFQCKACKFGSCNLDDGTCDCFDGYYGEFCEKTCPGRCSGKNGVCQADGKCRCEPGFTGDDCSLQCCVRNFGTDLGRVHGKCNINVGGCSCDSGWSGPECDCNAEVTCSGRGSCSDGDCVCEPQFQGARCEMCNDTRVGPFCQYDRYQCPSLESVNGEFVAINNHGDYACKCNAGFMGEHCEMCTPSAYPKSGPSMCTYIVPASLCNRGQVKDDFAGSGVMCDCEINFDSGTDCQNCKSKYFGPDCDIFCDVQCSNSGGTCVNYPEPGCLCPPGKTNVGGVCVVCGGDSECVHGECFRGRCQCDPGYYGDDCNTSAPIFKDKVCNGYTPVLKFETATCETAADCTSTVSDDLANRQVAYRAQQYGRDMFCHRLDTPLELKDETGCCVDANFDGKCDENMLDDQVCANGELVVDICNERVLEGEVNVFEWCLSQERGCTKNGECVDPDLCQNRCDLGLTPDEWTGKWERDHIESMASLMSETWKFPVTFPDPYEFRKSYIYENPCPSTHPHLGGPFYGNQYWCYVSPPDSDPCNMASTDVPPPPGGVWGSNQADCKLNCKSFSVSMESRVCEENTGDIVKLESVGAVTLGQCADLCIEADGFSWKSSSSGCYCYTGTIEGCASRETTWSQYIFSDDEECYKKPVPALDADINDICVSGTDYDTCRDYLIPDTRVFNMTHMYVDEWKPLPTFDTCEFGRYLFATDVNGTKTVALEEPIYAGRIEVISDPRMSAAFARYQNGNESYPDANGDANTMIDSITFFGKGKVEVVVYNYTTEECADFIRKSAYHFENCKRIQFYELDYSWSAFCEWRLTVSVSGGFDQRCYDQSRVCAGCEDYQEGCEGLPLKSEYDAPMPFPCNTYWDDFCDIYLNETAKPTGYCAYAECECDGYAIGGDACNLQCPVPQFTGTEAPCGEDMDPPWGKCNPHIGAIAFGFEQGECDCYNGGSPSVGCAQVCEGEQDCSPDIDTPFSFITFNCSDIADVQSIEILSETEQRCHVHLRDSVCNYWRGRCECATPFTAFTKLEEPMYFNEGSYRIALMQGYEIDQYAPFVKYVPPEDSILRLMKQNRLCADEFIYPAEDGLVCADEGTKKKNTDWTEDRDGKRCKDYTESDCQTLTLVKEGAYCFSHGNELAAGNFPDRLDASDPLYDLDPATECMNRCLAEWPATQGIYVSVGSGKCGQCKHTCDETTTHSSFNAYKVSNMRYDDKIPSSVACEKNSQYDVEDMTKEECLAFRSFESSTSISNSDASDVYDYGYEFKTGFRVFDFGKEERLWNLEIFDPGAYCKVKVAGPNGASRGLGCDGARGWDFSWSQAYCEVTNSNLFEGNAGYNPNFEDEKLYYKTCCEWTGSECVDNAEFTDGHFVVEQLDASSITEAFASKSWSFVDFVGHGNNYINIKSRFVRVRGIAHHPVKIRPHLTTTDYLVSDTKQGCIKDQNDITYYDFKPDVYTSEKVECSYTFRTFGKCDVSYSKGTLGLRECAEACREDERVMFTMESGECMCAADDCNDFTITSDRMYHINDNDACGYKFRYQGSCNLEKDFTGIVDHKECRDMCYEEGYTSFSMPCKCQSQCTKGIYSIKTSGTCDTDITTLEECVSAFEILYPGTTYSSLSVSTSNRPSNCFIMLGDSNVVASNTGSGVDCGHVDGGSTFNCICKNLDIYHIQSGYTPHDFIEIKTKSCEHFGHKTINSKELCKNGSLVLGYDYEEAMQIYRYDMAGTDNWKMAKDDCEAEGLQLCSLADICPDGPLTTPYGGIDNKDTWVPVIDEEGAHVSVGNVLIEDRLCRRHLDSLNNLPTWYDDSSSNKPYRSKKYCCGQRKGKSSVSFLERIQQAVVHYDGASGANDCAAQDFYWDGDAWYGTGASGGHARRLQLREDRSKFDCQYYNGNFRSSIDFDDVTFTYPSVHSVAECKENCGRKFKPYTEVTTEGVFTDLDTQCSKDSNKIKDIVPEICLSMISSLTGTVQQVGCEGARLSNGNYAEAYCTANHGFFIKGHASYLSKFDPIGEYYRTCCKWEDDTCKEKYIPDVCRRSMQSPNFGNIIKGCDGARWTDKSYASTYCDGTASNLPPEHKHYYSTCCTWDDNMCKEKYVDEVKQACVEEDCSHTTPTAIYSDCQPSDVEEFAYTLQSGGSCEYPVLTQEECQKAKNSIQASEIPTSYTVPAESSNTKPPGCLYKHKEVIFNTDNPVLSCGEGDYRCICRVPLSWRKVEKSQTCVCSDREIGPTYVFIEAGKMCTSSTDPPGTLDSNNYVTFLDPSHPLASDDRAQECANRCHSAGYSHFFTKNSNEGRCKCAQDDCTERTDQADTTSYAISPQSDRTLMTDPVPYSSGSIYDILEIHLKVDLYGCPAATFYKIGSVWKSSGKCLKVKDTNSFYCSPHDCSSYFTSISKDDANLEYRYELPFTLTSNMEKDYAKFTDFGKSVDISIYHTASPNHAKGCNAGVYNEDPSDVSCENCICLKGQSSYKSDFVEVNSHTCEDHGFHHITTLSTCLEALKEFNFNTNNLAQLYFTQSPQYTDVPLGCAKHPERPFSLAGVQPCTEDKPCLCSRTLSVSYTLQSSGTCADIGAEEVTEEECATAAVQLGLSDTSVTLTAGRNTDEWPPRCYLSNNVGLRFNDPPGIGSCRADRLCICKNPRYAKSDRYEMKTSGTCSFEVTSKDECIAAAAIFGVLKNEDPENDFLNHQSGAKCGVWNKYVHYGEATTQCSEVYPCICRLEPPPTVFVAGNCEDFDLLNFNSQECEAYAAGAGEPTYLLKDSGTCDEYITTEEECETAVAALGGALQNPFVQDSIHQHGCMMTNEGSALFSSNTNYDKACNHFTGWGCICKVFYQEHTEGTMPQNKCLYVNGVYHFNTGTSSSKCSDRVPCVCKGKSPVSIGICPEGTTSRTYGFSEICYPTAKSTPKGEREIISEFVTDKYKVEEIGTGMCAPDHDMYFHDRDNPYRVSDNKAIPDADACKNECLNTEGCTGFSFSANPTLNYRTYEGRDNCYWGSTGASGWWGETMADSTYGDGVLQTRSVDAAECIQFCEEYANRRPDQIPTGTVAYAGAASNYLDPGLGQGGCRCIGPGLSWTKGSYNCNSQSFSIAVTKSDTTCVLSTDGCDKPVLLGDGKCSRGRDYNDKTMEECEQLCIDNDNCRTFSWRPKVSLGAKPNCRISKRECHYSYHRLDESNAIPPEDDPPKQTMEHDYVLLLVNKYETESVHGSGGYSNMEACHGDCDSGQCMPGTVCYERTPGYLPPPGCYGLENFNANTHTDYCVYEEYMSGTAIKPELLDNDGNLLPHVPSGGTCEENGWHTIMDEHECMQAAQLLLPDNTANLLFEDESPSDFDTNRPAGCFYDGTSVRLNTDTSGGNSNSQYKSICRRGWKRYSLGKTDYPGTRYSFTKKNKDLKPHHMGISLKVGEEYAIQRSGKTYTIDHGPRIFEASLDSPGWDRVSDAKYCNEACLKMSHISYAPWTAGNAGSWKQNNDDLAPVFGAIVSETDGRCYCQESMVSGEASKRNIGAWYSTANTYYTWTPKAVKKEFLRRKEFAGGDAPWECPLHIVSATQSSDYSTYTASGAIDNDLNTLMHTSNDANPWLQLNLAPGVKSIGSVKIRPRDGNGGRLSDFKLQWRVFGGSWIDCGTYFHNQAEWKSFPCDVNSAQDIEAVRIYKTQSDYMDLAEVKVRANCGSPIVPHTSHNAYETIGSLDDPTGRATKCGEVCQSANTKSFTVNIETGHCTCYNIFWDAFGNDPYYNSYTGTYFRNDMFGSVVQRGKDLHQYHYEIIQPRKYRNMHYGKGRYCGTVGTILQVTGNYYQMQEQCYQLCENSQSFLLGDNGDCVCQDTSAECHTLNGATITERPWIVNRGGGQCTEPAVMMYDDYDAPREEQIKRCAFTCATYGKGTSNTNNHGDYSGFLLPLETSATNTNDKGRCWCELDRTTNPSCGYATDTDWERWDFDMMYGFKGTGEGTTGNSYKYVKFSTCLSICMDSNCDSFSYSGEECVIPNLKPSYTQISAGSYCTNHVAPVYQPTGASGGYVYRLETSDSLYDADPAQECANRCFAEGRTSFYLLTHWPGRCMCGKDDCSARTAWSPNSYSITPASPVAVSRVASSRIYDVSNRNTYQQFEILNEDPASITPPHMGVPLLQNNQLEISKGYKSCDIPYQLISERTCSELDGEPVASKIKCEAALAQLGYSVTVDEVAFAAEPPGCYYDTNDGKGKFNTMTEFVPASASKQSVCEVPLLRLTKEQCQEYAENQGLPFEAVEDIPEFDFVCHVIMGPPYVIKTNGFCDNPFTDSAKCRDAMNQLGLNDDSISGVNYSPWPWGCLTENPTTVAINYYDPSKTVECGSSGMNCICDNPATPIKIVWTPYKTSGMCLQNDFPVDVESTGTYKYEEFNSGLCEDRKCEALNYKWTKRTPACAYLTYAYRGSIRARHRGRTYNMHISQCVSECVNMLTEGWLGQVNTGVHKIIINRWRGNQGTDAADSDRDEFWTDSCDCVPLQAARFCDENAAERPTHVDNVRQSSGSVWGATVLPNNYNNIHSITVTAEVKCNYASVFRTFKAFARSVVTFQSAVDECFKACVTGSLFHRGGVASVGDMNINGFRVERGTYSNELRASCDCVEIPETPEECEIQSGTPTYKQLPSKLATKDDPTGGYFGYCSDGTFSFEYLGTGYCSNYKYLAVGSYPSLLPEDDVNYHGDRRRECMNRCLADNPSYRGFFTKLISGEYRCACAEDDCAVRSGSSPHLSYRIDLGEEVVAAAGKSALEACEDMCTTRADCDAFSFYEGNNHNSENYQCLFANRGCGKRGDHDYKWVSYAREDPQVFKIITSAAFEQNKAKYTISSEDEVGSPVFFPKDNFIPQDKEEWYTHLDFTKYSVETNCIGKEPIFDDECEHAQSLFPEWQVQACPTGFTQIDDFCQKVEEIPNTKCTFEFTPDETVVKTIAFVDTDFSDDYIVTFDGATTADPMIQTCQTFKVTKSFSNHPLNIMDESGTDVATDIMDEELTLSAGTYTYYCTSHPLLMRGEIKISDCSPSPLYEDVTGNCAQECSRLFIRGNLGHYGTNEYLMNTHYASDCRCHFTRASDECLLANNTAVSDKTLYKIMTTPINECINDAEMICKDAPQEKDEQEDYMCMSSEDIKVFDSTNNCVICGGGQSFDIGSVFFNENGDSDTCVYAEETEVCDEQAPGWSQYQLRYGFDSYEKDEKSGYCENFKDMELDFSDSLLSEMIESCATACRAYEEYTAFSLSRTFCFCTTTNCDTRIGASDTFKFRSNVAVAVDTAEIVQKWNSNAPGLRCFKDLNLQEEAPCDWIRALKHFARGGSYRIGDCHNLAPGTHIDTQIPCNGHGFPSAGVCACDYAENFELRSSGVGLTFEAPNLRQTPFRGKACEFMCPGYDMFNMDSVCSGHGRCETDGRCSCEQGFTGYNCHLACETETKALTCSGHGVCNEREQPLRRDIVEILNDMECKNETLYLARDRVIKTGDIIQYMYKSLDGLSIDSFLIPRLVTVDFKSSNTSYKISIDGSQDQENPVATVCQTFTVIKSFSGEPFSIRKNTGETLAYNWDTPQQETFTAEPGRYEYLSVNSPLTHRGFIDVVDCTGKSTRIASIDDFYIRGETVRRPFNSISNFPYMPCKDRINITRETAYHPLVEHTTPNITVECSLLSGYQDEAYMLMCGMCQCEESQATGFWSGYDCRTPAEGYFGNDGRDACPGLTADKKPCNGGGTCTWGSVDGFGDTPYVDAQCFCGDTTLDSTYATAPRNLDGDMMFHIMNFDDALYVDTLDIVGGNETERTCFHGTVPVGFQECQHDWVSNGGVESIISEAAIVTDVRNDIVLDFDSPCDSPGTLIDKVSVEELLLVGNKREQKMKCAGACFGEYKFSFDGRCPNGGVLVLNEDTNPGATWDEKSEYCADACRTKALPIVGEWSNTANPGFSIKQNGECVCDAELGCTQIISDEWKHFDFVTPFIFRHTGSIEGKEFEVGPPAGDSDSERLEWCASKCQHFVFDDQSIAKGFLYTSTIPSSCICQAGAGSDVLNDGRDRYDYTHFKGFTVNYDVTCKCEVEESCTPGSGDGDRFKILGDIHPEPYTLEQRVSLFDGDFICLKNNIVQCKSGPLELTNYNQNDCSCKFGFTGNTCETPRMMCIFAGQETDGTSCICSVSDGTINPKVRSSGCCTNGLYWDQIRYSSFSPLVDFDIIPDNIFYYDALKSVCKPGPMKLKSVSEGADAVRIHNYAALTDELYITNPAICNFPKELSMYKAVYKYNSATADTLTLTITKEEIRALGYKYDDLFDQYIEEYAKDRCLYRCTHRTVDEDAFKSFHLRKTRINLEEDTFIRGDDEDEIRTFDGSYAGHKNPGNLNNNVIEEDEIEFCRRSCISDLQSATTDYQNMEFRTKGYVPTHFAVDKGGRCYCFADLGGQISTSTYSDYKRFNMVPDIEYDCTCSTKPAFVGGNNGNSYVEPIFVKDQKVYDIVYPMDRTAIKQNIDCFDANVNLIHVDIQVETDVNLMTGLPSSITPVELNIKGTRVKKDVTNFHDCYKACHGESNQIVANSFLWGRKPQIPIVFAGNPVTPYTKLKHCWSHCNSDSDCDTGLKCVTRYKDNTFVYAWPGCIEPADAAQTWGSGDTISNNDNICYDITQLQDECHCTVHDPDEPPCTNLLELMGAGYCSNYKYLGIGSYPPVLSEGDANYDADKRRECMNRCLAEYPNTKAFFTKTVGGEERCACAQDYCAERSGSSPYLSYTIQFCETNTRPGFLMEEHTDFYKLSTPKLIVESDVEYEDAMPVNPYTCGLESIIHQGDIVSSSCTCPINDFEEVFVEYEYKELTQTGTCHSYYTISGDLNACKVACDSGYGCNSFSFGSGQCFLAVDCDKDWDVREFAPFFCYGDAQAYGTLISSSNTPEACADSSGTVQFGHNSDASRCYPFTREFINMDECTRDDGTAYGSSHDVEPTQSGGTYTPYAFRNSITEILKGSSRNDWYYGGLTYRSYSVFQTPRYDISNDKRYVKQIKSDTKDFYCTVGEQVVYTVDVTDTLANDHSCMQICREEYSNLEFVIARGETKGDIFECLCSDFNPDGSVCGIGTANTFNGGKQYKVSNTPSSSCKCPGFYIFDGQAISCPSGRYSGEDDPCMSSCKLCPRGRFSQVGYTECESCPAGKIQEGLSCKNCPAGQSSPAGLNECFTCALGLFTDVKGTPSCFDCPNGYYDDIATTDAFTGTSCKICPRGYFAGLATKSDCSQCQTGRFGDSTGMAECKLCLAGKYQPSLSATLASQCTSCSAGRFQNIDGQASCKNCGTGKYQTQTGRTGCISCPVGWYQNSNGQTGCKGCPKGYYRPQTGYSSCAACPTGKYADQTIRVSCKTCSAGKYQNQNARTTSSECHNCASGKYQGQSGKSSCTSCGDLKSGYSWGTGPDRTTKEKSCDSYNKKPTSYYDMFWASGCAYDRGYDCGRTRFTGSGNGDQWRRTCWTGDSNNCNTMARGYSDRCDCWSRYDPGYYSLGCKSGWITWTFEASVFCIPGTGQYSD